MPRAPRARQRPRSNHRPRSFDLALYPVVFVGLGDMDAWQISGGLYLQAAGPCGTVQIFRQASNGSISLISPAGTTGNDLIRTVYRSRMLPDAQTGCPGSTSLLWYDPRTKAEQWPLRTPSTEIGVISAIPYYSRQNAQ
jgi:TolB protein